MQIVSEGMEQKNKLKSAFIMGPYMFACLGPPYLYVKFEIP